MENKGAKGKMRAMVEKMSRQKTESHDEEKREMIMRAMVEKRNERKYELHDGDLENGATEK